jgi:phosphoglycolate phosphatase-like HAD superfamily hydrolase
MMRLLPLMLATFTTALGPVVCAEPAFEDPLPSWNEGASKTAILAFVAKVTRSGGPEYVAPAERIAVFDNDGTLWPEDPLPCQFAFILDELDRLAPDHPEWKSDALVQGALKRDLAGVLRGGTASLIHLVGLTHAGMTTDDYRKRVEAWLARARHPRWNKPYTDLAYQPMLELLAFLRASGFKTFIVSGGGADFMRVWAERVYGIPPEQVIGSNSRTVLEHRPDGPVLIKTTEHLFVDDKDGKPVAIHQFIGRRPIACFGNSDGDQAMLEWTTTRSGPSFGLIVHHTDAEREYAYDAEPKSSGKLTTALEEAHKRGWTVVSMKRDWNRLFTFSP